MQAATNPKLKAMHESLATLEFDLNSMRDQLFSEIESIRTRVDTLNEDFISGVTKVIREEFDAREAKYQEYFDKNFGDIMKRLDSEGKVPSESQAPGENQKPMFEKAFAKALQKMIEMKKAQNPQSSLGVKQPQ